MPTFSIVTLSAVKVAPTVFFVWTFGVTSFWATHLLDYIHLAIVIYRHYYHCIESAVTKQSVTQLVYLSASRKKESKTFDSFCSDFGKIDYYADRGLLRSWFRRDWLLRRLASASLNAFPLESSAMCNKKAVLCTESFVISVHCFVQARQCSKNKSHSFEWLSCCALRSWFRRDSNPRPAA